jgi:hypothetical protein
MKGALLAFGLAMAAPATAAEPAKPLFADDQLIHIIIRAPINRIASSKDRSRNVVGTLAINSESLPIRLSPRGITRLRKETCQFPPLRVDFTSAPPAGSLFAGQRRLKLVTHCRSSEGHQQYLLLEYAAYRLYNQLTPSSFRARLAQVDYVEDNGKLATSRLGFFLEDVGDVARRNGMTEAKVATRIPITSLNPADAARFAVFEYLISNLDWAMQAGAPGDRCCHNSRLVSGNGAPPFTTIPYDFDYSGLVDAPYAVPPEGIDVSSVKARYYRGFCRDNAEALRAAADIRAQGPTLIGILGQIPQLKDNTRRKATAFLERSLADIATDQAVTANLLKTCV